MQLKSLGLLLSFLTLSGCQTVGNWADNAGEHLPVIGDRCEHWQCMTDSGKARSDEIKEQQAKAQAKVPATPPAPDNTPVTPAYPEVSSQRLITAAPQ